MDNQIIINPLKIPKNKKPIVVFSSEDNAFISWLIRIRTNGQYNHTMWMIPEGFATQGMVFKKVPVEKYIKSGIKLKFFKIKDITKEERKEIYKLIDDRCKLPWWRRRYDFLGVIGQAIGLKMLNNPYTSYCSEQMASDISKVIFKIKGKPTPEELEEIIKKNPRFEYIGHYIKD